MSLPAYQAAIEDGADGFECDVRLTKDNQLILWHDPDLQRIAGNRARVADSTLKEIKRLHPGAITLEELLILARDSKKELAI
jgi:glycerophosphoryl diester phosphodiesterase